MSITDQETSTFSLPLYRPYTTHALPQKRVKQIYFGATTCVSRLGYQKYEKSEQGKQIWHAEYAERASRAY